MEANDVGKMRILISFALIMLTGSAVAIVPLKASLPPFEPNDLDASASEYGENLTVPQLRAVLSLGRIDQQGRAAQALIKAKDQKTLLRLIYALKQGNPFVENLLISEPNLLLVSLLLEDIAHGSMETYGDDLPPSDVAIRGRVRLVATEVCIRALSNSSELPDNARERLVTALGKLRLENDVSEASRLVLTWWLLNRQAADVGKWSEVRDIPLHFVSKSAETPDPHPQYRGVPLPLPPPRSSRDNPWGPTWEVSESFEAWSARIVDPKKRDLRFADLTWNRGWQVHPLRNLLTEPMAPLPEKSASAIPSPDETQKDESSPPNESPPPAPGASFASRFWAALTLIVALGGAILWWAFFKDRRT